MSTKRLSAVHLGAFASAPGTAIAGDSYWDTALVAVRVYNGSTWQNVGSASSGSVVTYAATAPAAPATGDMWIESDVDAPAVSVVTVDTTQTITGAKTFSLATIFSSTISATGLAGSLLSSANPLALGTVGPGTSAIPSRQDHVHPTTGLMANPLTTTGDIIYGAGSTPTRLAGSAVNGTYFLQEAVVASAAVAPTWVGSTGTGNVVLAAGPTFTGTVLLPTATTKIGQTFLLQGGAVNITFPTAAGTLIGTGDTGSIITAMLANSSSTATGATYAKMQYVSAQYRMLGRITAAAGVVEELTPDNLVTVLGQATVTSARQGTGAVVLATSPTITTPTIASFTNATHTHADAAGGGTLSGYATDTLVVHLAGVESITGAKTFTSGTTVFGSATATQQISLLGGAGAHAIEIGRRDNVASTPVIDFHSGTTGANDYDARILATGGGVAAGAGTLYVNAFSLKVADTPTSLNWTGVWNSSVGVRTESVVPSFDLMTWGTERAVISAGRARGTQAAETSLQDNDIVLDLNAYGRNPNGWPTFIQMLFEVEGTPVGAVLPGRIVFKTMNAAGTLSERVRITAEGALLLSASTTLAPSLRVPHGTAPTTPTDGDVWTTTAGMYVRVNGATVGPLGAGGGAGDSDQIILPTQIFS